MRSLIIVCDESSVQILSVSFRPQATMDVDMLILRLFRLRRCESDSKTSGSLT